MTREQKLKRFVTELIAQGQKRNELEGGKSWGKGGKYDEYAGVQLWNKEKIASSSWIEFSEGMEMALLWDGWDFTGRKSIYKYAKELGFYCEKYTTGITGFYLSK